MRQLAALIVLLLVARSAAADPPDRVFAGSIMVSAKAFAPAETVAAIKKQAAVTFAEDKKDHTWTLFLVGYFKAPVDDMEYVLKVRDLSNKSQIVMSADKYLSARGLRSASTKIVLDKEKVGVNKELLVTMESKGKLLATTRIQITGEGEHFTGKVDFSADDDDDGAKVPDQKH
jgi:hypothetical protein